MEQSREYQALEARLEGDPEYILHGLLYDIAENIYVAMEEQGLTQADLAERAGMNPPALSRFLRTAPNTTLRTIVRLASALDRDVEDVLKRSGARLARMGRERARASLLEPEEGLLRPAPRVDGSCSGMWKPGTSRRQPTTGGALPGGDSDHEYHQLNAAT